MLDISEVLDDTDFIQTVEFGIVTRNGGKETVFRKQRQRREQP